MSTDNKRKHLTIARDMYSTDSVRVQMAVRARQRMEDDEEAEFQTFLVDVGNLFIELKAELDEAVENLSDDFSDPDPRKWDMGDWGTFELAVTGHKYEEFIRTYATGVPNIELIWKELSNRLNIS